MTQTDLETGTVPARRPKPFDLWLNIAVAAFVVVFLAGAGYFGWTVYRDRQVEEASSATGRLVAALVGQKQRLSRGVEPQQTLPHLESQE